MDIISIIVAKVANFLDRIHRKGEWVRHQSLLQSFKSVSDDVFFPYMDYDIGGAKYMCLGGGEIWQSPSHGGYRPLWKRSFYAKSYCWR